MGSAILDQLDTFGPHRCDVLTYEQACDYTRRLAKSHYENFSVVSWMLPRRLRDDFRHVYSFCRWADDLGDETGDPRKSLALLAWWRSELDACYAGTPRHPVFVALRPTVERHDIPRKPFDDLIDAFVQDQNLTRYDTWAQVLDYCTRSANPVGRLVLYLCGYRDEQRQQLSDATCTALQLANFWQDVRRDIVQRNRVYLPREIASKHALDLETMVKAVQLEEGSLRQGEVRCPACPPSAGITAILPAYRAAVKEAVDRTWPLFVKGRELWPTVEPAVRVDIELFSRGGEAILRMIERLNHDTLRTRPSLSRGAKLALMLRAIARKLLHGGAVGGGA